MLESIFKKVADFYTCNFTKKRPQHRRFPVNTAEFLALLHFLPPSPPFDVDGYHGETRLNANGNPNPNPNPKGCTKVL